VGIKEFVLLEPKTKIPLSRYAQIFFLAPYE
jgi:hypothetical protein